MPFYLDSTGFKNVSGAPGPFQNAHETDLGLFPWLIADPPMLTHFNNFMSGQRMNRKDWYDFYPVDDILFKDANGDDSDATLLIDIAGGEGHDTEAFHKRFPNAPGKLILQDLPATIDNIKHLDGAVVRMKYDFFTPQPIQGARAYYYRSIFHDWPDKDCISIMKNTAVAMKKGHSKLLIFEWILPDRSVPLYPALLDINMMALLNGMERTRAQWTALLEAAGLKVIKFWTVGDDVEGLIEAELM
jgi:O-methyltransferase domain